MVLATKHGVLYLIVKWTDFKLKTSETIQRAQQKDPELRTVLLTAVGSSSKVEEVYVQREKVFVIIICPITILFILTIIFS